MPEDLRPELTDPIQLKSNRNIHHKSDSPAWAERHSTSSRRVQVAPGRGGHVCSLTGYLGALTGLLVPMSGDLLKR